MPLTIKRILIFYCFLSFLSFSIVKVLFSQSFIDGALYYSAKSLDFQRIYVKRTLRNVRKTYLNWIQTASEIQIKEHLAVSHFGSKLYESLQAYMHVSKQLPTSTWVRDSFYSIVYFELMKIEDFIEQYYSSNLYDYEMPVMSLDYMQEYQDAVSRRVFGELSSNEFKKIEQAIGSKLRDSDLSDQTKEAIRVFLFLQFQSLGGADDKNS